MKIPFSGGCQCNQVRYNVLEGPIRLTACHCKQCQKQSGSAFGLSLLIKKNAIELSGTLKKFDRIADSGNHNTGYFCPNCGNRIYNRPHRLNELLNLKPGTLDDTQWLYPEFSQWMKSAQGWVVIPENVKISDEQNY